MSKRAIKIVGGIAYVPLTKGFVAVVDVEDVPIVDGFNWFVKVDARCAYAMRKSRVDGARKAVLMHREIAGASAGVEVDHRDCDGLNNRRANLRCASRADNTRNTRLRSDNKSGAKGVHWSSKQKRWVAAAYIDGKQRNLGSFLEKEDAIRARNAYADATHGEFARHE